MTTVLGNQAISGCTDLILPVDRPSAPSQSKALSFPDLVSPLSKNKLVLLVEARHPLHCGSLHYSLEIANYLEIKMDSIPNDYEAFVERGFFMIERSIAPHKRNWAEGAVDFFRQKKFINIVQAYLFIDEQLIAYSGDGQTSMFDVLHDLLLGQNT